MNDMFVMEVVDREKHLPYIDFSLVFGHPASLTHPIVKISSLTVFEYKEVVSFVFVDFIETNDVRVVKDLH